MQSGISFDWNLHVMNFEVELCFYLQTCRQIPMSLLQIVIELFFASDSAHHCIISCTNTYISWVRMNGKICQTPLVKVYVFNSDQIIFQARRQHIMLKFVYFVFFVFRHILYFFERKSALQPGVTGIIRNMFQISNSSHLVYCN